MNDAKALLDRFLGQVQGAGSATSTPMSDAGGTLGTLRQAAGQLDLQGLLKGKGGFMAGSAAGGLAGLLLGGKKPRKLAGTALKLGGAALIGGLAYKAWRDWQANKAPATAPAAAATLPSPEGTAFLPHSSAEQDDLSVVLLRAMIAAAKADGHIDERERARIAAQLDGLELDPDQKAFIEAELAQPLDVGAVASGATTPERAAEIYAASLLAIDPEGAAEKGYLAMLAARMNLDPDLVAHLHANTAEITANGTF
ncbi:tellurite resistance TerB family protein [Acuticoccus sp. M5D2P5]|uniref:tellurite resistance TerB family protein n=1 Tax=Acuticoccus kalidii TaxID=2910977 RepID=UPI001F3919AB|nr:tellurite resistance TerB family protein [Acuticoccus kalidii]MCF3934047.1 tellurite resistance TerB family protein [Acuticoccus kalidii]